MRLLLDTHIWLWLNLTPERLPAVCAAALADPDSEIVVSVASVWELSIKHKLGKIDVGGPFLPFVDGALEDIELLDVRLSHVRRGHDLPPIHRDPFDRIIIAQALAEGWTLLSVDHVFAAYGVNLIPS
jgi:PIN domain nuclease of toxin-antitoxin system